MSVVVKICGITNAEDGLAAAGAGANALGFVFHAGSPRCVTPETVREIIRALPPFVVKVGVFVDADEQFVFHALRLCGLNVLQFHGNEPPDYCRSFGAMSMKAFRISGAESIRACANYSTDAFLLDAYSPGQLGGTGETFNWDLAREVSRIGPPIFLAGGLTPQNVGEAIRRVRPYGVDVSSGVESSPGHKDHAKIRAFIDAVRNSQ